jgi:hypothetical protein
VGVVGIGSWWWGHCRVAAFLVSGLHKSNFLFITVSGFVIAALSSILQVFAKALNCLDRVFGRDTKHYHLSAERFRPPDDNYLAIETTYTLAAVLRGLRSVVTTKYVRVKLADNVSE